MKIPRLLQHAAYWWVAVALWYGILYAASSQATYLPPSPFAFSDKVQHALYFMAGGCCVYIAQRLQGRSGWLLVLSPILFCMIVGAADEYRQSFTPGRCGNDIGDWTADSIGGVLAWLLGRKLRIN
jgi:VanZ family protein